jgi:hypothetical protein
MCTIIFWNVARVGSGDASENLDDDLTFLGKEGAKVGVDAIILCEVNARFNPRVIYPPGYSVINVDRSLGTYAKSSTLQYVLYGRNNVRVGGLLLGLYHSERPALAVEIGAEYVIALHAPSAGQQTQTPQCNAILKAYELLMGEGIEAKAVIGDLNMDVNILGTQASILLKLKGPGRFGGAWQISAPAGMTHRNPKTSLYDTKLDWAWVCNPLSTAATIDGSGSTGGDDDEWSPEANLSKSDHKPILFYLP